MFQNIKNLADNLNTTDVGLGIDIEENKRFARYQLDRDKDFLDKVFTSGEIQYCFSKTDPAKHLCARFAAKEAAIKALKSLGFPRATYRDAEIINGEFGQPILKINRKFGVTGKVSLSHDNQNSAAVVLIEKNYGRN